MNISLDIPVRGYSQSNDHQIGESIHDTFTANGGIVWENLVVAKETAQSWVKKAYRGSIMHDFVVLFTSPVL